MRRIEDSRAMMERMARKVSRRLRAAGVSSVDIDDVRSELTIAWCLARDAYDPAGGAAFSTFLWRGMINHVKRWVEREIRISSTALSLDADRSDDGDETTLHDAIAASDAGPHEIVEERQLRALAASELSADTQLFLDLLENPSDDLDEALEAARSRAEFARSRGLKAVAPTAVTAAMVFDLMGATRTQRHRSYAELRHLSEKVNQK